MASASRSQTEHAQALDYWRQPAALIQNGARVPANVGTTTVAVATPSRRSARNAELAVDNLNDLTESELRTLLQAVGEMQAIPTAEPDEVVTPGLGVGKS